MTFYPKKLNNKNNEFQGKLETESPLSNVQFKRSNTSNEEITTVIVMTWYRNFLCRRETKIYKNSMKTKIIATKKII